VSNHNSIIYKVLLPAKNGNEWNKYGEVAGTEGKGITISIAKA